jgi:hypothetical protein
MKFACPHCQQTLEIPEAQAGQVLACPTCGQSFALPEIPKATPAPAPAPAQNAARSAKAPPKQQRPSAGATQSRRPVRKRGGGKFLLVLVLLAAGAFGYAMFHYHESPQQVWQRLLKGIEALFEPAPTPTPTPAPTPAPAPGATPTSTPVATATPAPTAAADPVAWLLENKNWWPPRIALTRKMTLRTLIEGQSGTAVTPVGTEIRILNLTPGQVTVNAYGAIQQSPIEATDLLQRAKAAMAAAASATAAETAAVAAATPTPEAAAPAEEAEDSANTLASDEVSVGKPGRFVHPGLLHNDEDFQRMRANRGREPWRSGYKMLTQNRHASLDWKPRPAEIVIRGSGRGVPVPQNYAQLFNDTAAAYACALRWKVSGDRRYAEKAIEILNAWSSTLKEVTGSTDACLAVGIYGYQFANAAEIMRTYKGWKPEDFARFQKMMLEKFYPGNKRFLEKHNGTPIDHYWANWDLCNIASMIAIGVLCDREDIYNYGIRYFKTGKGNGAIRNAVTYIHPDGLGQWQEAGRDQGHTTMGIALTATICEMAWKQGDDLYGYDDNRFLKGCEYVAKYNLGKDVPYRTYKNSDVTQEKISDAARGSLRPGWELVYNHYVVMKGLPAPYTSEIVKKVRPEGGGGDYGPNSGGYDQLGYGTLTATLDKNAKPGGTPSFFGKQAAPSSPTPDDSAQ